MFDRRGVSRFFNIRTTGLGAAAVTAALLLGSGPVSANNGGSDEGNFKYKGAETLDVVSVGLNPARCGDAPTFEAVFDGNGIDTAGGVFTAVSSGCQNIVTGEVFDLVAVDTYANGDTVSLAAAPFVLEFDPQTCASANADPIPYTLTGGTGAFAGVTGGGTFDFASNDPSCNGEIAPAYVWFRGKIK